MSTTPKAGGNAMEEFLKKYEYQGPALIILEAAARLGDLGPDKNKELREELAQLASQLTKALETESWLRSGGSR